MSARPRGVGGDDATDRRLLGVGRIEREPLTTRPQRRLKRGHRHAGLDSRRQIARLVLEQLGESPQAQNESGARGRRANGGGRPPTPRHDRDVRSRGDLDDGTHLVDRTRKEGGFGRAPLDDVRSEVHVAEDVGGTNDGSELVENRDIHGRFPRPR